MKKESINQRIVLKTNKTNYKKQEEYENVTFKTDFKA